MVNYKLDEKNRIVKCVLIDKPYGRRGKVRKSVGVAVCSSEDEFNEQTGKDLAFYRARIAEIGCNIGDYSEMRKTLDSEYKELCSQIDNKIQKQRKEIEILKEKIKNIL